MSMKGLHLLKRMLKRTDSVMFRSLSFLGNIDFSKLPFATLGGIHHEWPRFGRSLNKKKTVT